MSVVACYKKDIMKKTPNKGKAKFKKGYVYKEDGSPTGKNITSLQQALAIDAECGCGIECECLGYLTLPVRDTATGLIVDYAALYFTSADGGVTITTVVEPRDVAQTNIEALKAL